MSKNKPDNQQSQDDSTKKTTHHFRMRHDWDNLMDELIQQGQDDGVFDNLSGKGKPLNLKKAVFGAELELAHNLMKENDAAPTWIMNRNSIQARLELLRKEIVRVWTRHEREFRVIQDPLHRDGLTLSWDDACQLWLAEIVEINKQIDEYNLKRPLNNLELYKTNLDRELKRVNASRWLTNQDY